MPVKGSGMAQRGWAVLVLRNPVMIKELRGRMRGARAFSVLTVYLTLLGVFAVLVYVAVTESSTSVSGQADVGEMGRTLFGGVVAIEMLLLAFIAPAFTAGAISGEREHQTFELLRATLLSPYVLVLGKLASSMLYVLLLLLAAIPLQSMAFFFGGVSETEVILALVVLAVSALFFCAVGVYFSARSRRTLSASLLALAVMLFFMFGIPLLVGTVLLLTDFSLDRVGASALERVMLYGTGVALSLNPPATALLTQYLLVNRHTAGLFSYTLVNGDTVTLVAPWIPFTVSYLTLASVLIALAVRRVNVVME
jgi:ABC-type transport system involved in multi-copper enzyme maturation permease subunit